MKLNINTIERDFIKCEIKDEYLKFKYNQNIKAKLKLSDSKYNKLIDPFDNHEFSNGILFKGALKSIEDIKVIKQNIKLKKIMANRDLKCNFTKMLSDLRSTNNNSIKNIKNKENKDRGLENKLEKMKCLDSNSSETLEKIGEKIIQNDNNRIELSESSKGFNKVYKSNTFNNPFLNEGDLFRLVHRDKKIKKIVVMKIPKLNRRKSTEGYIELSSRKNNKEKMNNKMNNVDINSSNNQLSLIVNSNPIEFKSQNIQKSFNKINKDNHKDNDKDKIKSLNSNAIKLSSTWYITDKINLKSNNYDLKFNNERYDVVKFFSVNRNTFFNQKNINQIKEN